MQYHTAVPSPHKEVETTVRRDMFTSRDQWPYQIPGLRQPNRQGRRYLQFAMWAFLFGGFAIGTSYAIRTIAKRRNNGEDQPTAEEKQHEAMEHAEHIDQPHMAEHSHSSQRQPAMAGSH